MLKKFFTFSRFTLFVALCISAIAAWYSVIGLTAIFAGAVIPIIIMGSILEIAKITTTVWLHTYWDRASYAIRTYLTVAVIALACLTSMGIFGLLSKAHLEQGVVSGEVQSNVSLLDEKIKIQRENIETARKALAQMDAQVDQRLARGDSENSAERAVAIRRQQAGERSRLLKEIADAQKEIGRINEERAPIASQLRKVEAEVGPIKYIAALVYGDNPDNTTLEKAVRWVTILIVAVFDPLAIVLILAANNSLKWEREVKPVEVEPAVEVQSEQPVVDSEPELHNPADKLEPDKVDDPPKEEVDTISGSGNEDLVNTINGEQVPAANVDPVDSQLKESTNSATYTHGNYGPYKYKSPASPPVITYAEGYGKQEPVQEKVVDAVEPPTEEAPPVEHPEEIILPPVEAVDELPVEIVDEPGLNDSTKNKQPIIETDGVTKEVKLKDHDEEYTIFNGKKISWDALRQLRPDLGTRNEPQNQILFGSKFPSVSKSGDIYTRIDVLPHRTFKFNDEKWIEVDRNQNTSYLQNIAYIQYLISKIDSGEYDAEFLSEIEQDEITEYLKRLT